MTDIITVAHICGKMLSTACQKRDFKVVFSVIRFLKTSGPQELMYLLQTRIHLLNQKESDKLLVEVIFLIVVDSHITLKSHFDCDSLCAVITYFQTIKNTGPPTPRSEFIFSIKLCMEDESSTPESDILLVIVTLLRAVVSRSTLESDFDCGNLCTTITF